MNYLISGACGFAVGLIVFWTMCSIRKRTRQTQEKSHKSKKKFLKLQKPNFTKLVLVAVLATYFIGLYVGIEVVRMDFSQFGILATYIATPTTTVIALYCWKAKAENLVKIKKGNPEETKDCPIDLNNISV